MENMEKALDILASKREANRRYRMKKENRSNIKEVERGQLSLEAARKCLAAYERQMALQKQKRDERGPLPKGRRFKCKESEELNRQLFDQLQQLQALSAPTQDALLALLTSGGGPDAERATPLATHLATPLTTPLATPLGHPTDATGGPPA